MRIIVAFCLLINTACFCYSQSKWESVSDSLGLESREKADLVLSKFDTMPGRKILYSLQNRDYLVVFNHNDCYKEYVLKVDSLCNVLAIKEIDIDEGIVKTKAKCFFKKRMLSRRLLEDRQILMKAFDESQYCTEFITSMPNASWVAGIPSYFVMKDENDNRYGEYSLSSITAPCPISPALWAFLIRELSDNKN
jgi:hypothetical protein